MCVYVCIHIDVFRKNVKASAVCRFSLSDVQEAFQGPYMENQDSGSKWTEYTGKIPDPRPGTVNTHEHTHTHRHYTTVQYRKKPVSLLFSLQGFTLENPNREKMKLIQSKDP